MPVPPSFSHSVMDANPGNLGESSSWAETQALEVRERPIYMFSGICYTSDGCLPAVSQNADGRHLGTFRIAGKC